MSRIGKQPVVIPESVKVAVNGQEVTVSGKKGELAYSLINEVSVEFIEDEKKLFVKPRNNSKRSKSMWGLSRSLVYNMVQGVSEGFSVTLEVTGVGYRAVLDGRILTLFLGYSHEIKVAIPKDIEVKCPKPTVIEISGISKQRVGQFASKIKMLRKTEPYKGKGIQYQGEFIRKKEGKKK